MPVIGIPGFGGSRGPFSTVGKCTESYIATLCRHFQQVGVARNDRHVADDITAQRNDACFLCIAIIQVNISRAVTIDRIEVITRRRERDESAIIRNARI